jgi:phosphoribosyl 1,2-cyclic phosphodiesterase
VNLFTRPVTVAVLSSGSGGNCTYVGDRHAGVLVDCGLSTKQILARMAEVGLAEAPVDAVLVTHEHSDHVGAARVLSRALAKRGKRVPFFMTAGTASAVDARCRPDGIEAIPAGGSFRVKHLVIEPVPVPHDTAEPCAYRVCVGGVRAAVITDLGKPTHLVTQHLRECDVAVLEFNHDEQMLLDGPYPFPLKQRIRSAHGHLSNAQARELLRASLGGAVRHVILAHLSEENNTPEKARTEARAAIVEGGGEGEVALHVAEQYRPLPPVVVQATAW